MMMYNLDPNTFLVSVRSAILAVRFPSEYRHTPIFDMSVHSMHNICGGLSGSSGRTSTERLLF